MKKILFLIISLAVFTTFFIQEVNAGSQNNVFGYAWSETIGWISFNCTDQDSCGTVDYGVEIDTNGKFSGYAWSENIGWIHFAPLGPYPDLPNYSAKLVANNQVSGWVRALAPIGDPQAGGWDGWIKMRDDNYGVFLDGDEFQDYAWGSDVVGWINFKGTLYGVKTTFSFNSPPDKPTTLPEEEWNHCSFKGVSTPTFYWSEFSDPDNGDTMGGYEIKIGNSLVFTDSGEVVSTAYTLKPWPDWMDWGNEYWWQVRVKDNHGNWSDWSDVNLFTTPIHAYPWAGSIAAPGFSWLPLAPSQGEVVIFDPEETNVYYSWTFNQGALDTYKPTDGTLETSEEPHIKFLISDNKAKLKVTDKVIPSYFCESDEKDITAQLPLPEYKEVAPTSWLKKFFGSFAAL